MDIYKDYVYFKNMMNKLKNLGVALFLLITQFSLTSIVKAASVDTTGLNEQDNALMGSSGLSGNSNLASIISVLISVILGFLGIVFLALTIMAGFKWMTSQGNETEIKSAQSSLKNSIIGLLIVIAAYAITYSVFKYLPFASSGTGGGGSGAI
jgi:Type IV secretion system pilin